jgi:hypothetical protein
MKPNIVDNTHRPVDVGLREILDEDHLPNWMFDPLLRALKRVDPTGEGSIFLNGMTFSTSGYHPGRGNFVKFDRPRTFEQGELGLIDYAVRRLDVDKPFADDFTVRGESTVIDGEFNIEGMLQTIATYTTDAFIGERTTIAMDGVLWAYWLEEMHKDGIQSRLMLFHMDEEQVYMGTVEHENMQLSLILNLTKMQVINPATEVASSPRLH